MKLVLEGLSVDLMRVTVVRGADLTVRPGELVGLVGPNGSGKTTLLRAVYRAAPRSSGVIWLDGQDVGLMPRSQVARTLGVLAQEQVADFDLTVWELVETARIPFGRRLTDEGAMIVAESLRRVGVADLADRVFHSLSGGEKQRVLMAKVLAQQPQLLLLDEPTNHLDIKYRLEVFSLVSKLKVSTLMAVHDLNLAAEWCDRVYVLNEGRIVTDGPPPVALRPTVVSEVFHVDAVAYSHPITGCHQLALKLPTSADPLAHRRPHREWDDVLG